MSPTDKELEFFAKPRVIMSKCLELEACRHDGQKIPNSFVRKVMPYLDLIPVCPEVEIGLGVPRDTIRLVTGDEGETRLVQPSTDKDLTDDMQEFAESFLSEHTDVDGIIFKSGSPTCGTSSVKVYQGKENAPPARTEPGMFAQAAKTKLAGVAIEDEGRLRNYPIRHHFLTQLYAFADLRETLTAGNIKDLTEVQRRYKHLLLVYDEPRLRELGRIAANPDGESRDKIMPRYRDIFHEALAGTPDRETYINALEHMYGHFKEDLTGGEREHFFELLEEYRNHQLPLFGVLSVLRQWVVRYDYDYFKDQALLHPYPRSLVTMRDSGKGVDF